MARRRSRRPSRPTKQSAALTLDLQIRGVLGAHLAAVHVTEFQFHARRLWRFDHAFPPYRVALEIEGGLFKGWRSKRALVNLAQLGQPLRPGDVALVDAVAGGRHSQPATMRADMEKYNEAAVLGWLVLRVTPEMIEDGRAIGWLEAAIKARDAEARARAGLPAIG